MENRFTYFQVNIWFFFFIFILIHLFLIKIYRVIDLQIIEDKADNDEYKNVEEFRADILTFVHNIIIFHGG